MNKKLLHFLLIVLIGISAQAQDSSGTTDADDASEGFTYGEFKGGYGITEFGSGLEERFEQGNFSTSGGGLFSVAAYRKFKSINYLHFGLKLKGLGTSRGTLFPDRQGPGGAALQVLPPDRGPKLP
ncbi:MAG: hypothetical protein ACK5W1_09015, partial [Flavobacteriales bacterium]